jgi:hypothetical protein
MTVSCGEIKELPGFGKTSAENIMRLRELGILNISTLMTVPNSPLKYLQQNMHLGKIYPFARI